MFCPFFIQNVFCYTISPQRRKRRNRRTAPKNGLATRRLPLDHRPYATPSSPWRSTVLAVTRQPA